jgi:phosphatidylglycerophosphatase A
MDVRRGLGHRAIPFPGDMVPGRMSDRDRWATLLGTWFGCGRAPLAPGTVGSLGALPAHAVLVRLPLPAHLGAIALLAALGVWAGTRMAERLGDDDPASVVIDEVIGTLIALALVRRRSIATQALGLVCFRLFDIWKPGPVDDAQRLKPPGVGIMADDVLAGLMAGLTARWLAR